MGSIANVGNSSAFTLLVNGDRLKSYNFNDTEKADMRNALEKVESSINEFFNDSWTTKDIDHLYEALADYYPRTMPGDDSEKVVYVDSKNETITTVEVRLHENREEKIEVILEPHNYSFDEFSSYDLYDMGIERRK